MHARVCLKGCIVECAAEPVGLWQQLDVVCWSKPAALTVALRHLLNCSRYEAAGSRSLESMFKLTSTFMDALYALNVLDH